MKLDRNQMELGLNVKPCRSVRRPGAIRNNRARWWFEQMRRAVERTPAPEEVYLVQDARSGMSH